MNRIKVLFFATLRDKAGTRMLELDIEPGLTVQQLKAVIVQRLPATGEVIEHCLTAVNHEYSDEQAEIPPDAEVAFFPPVSGGCL
jgi:molybdopterin converting factor subunit 1